MKRKFITVAEAFKILSEKEEPNEIEKENLQYTELLNRYGRKSIAKVMEEVEAVADLPINAAIKLIDLKPKTKEEMTAILSSYNLMLSEKDLNNLIDYFTSD
ncbi:hypothetical protein IX51_04440 [uncultured archaeon]|nr:hypothetical protein IX51_04440 [uncultured archaeon]